MSPVLAAADGLQPVVNRGGSSAIKVFLLLDGVVLRLVDRHLHQLVHAHHHRAVVPAAGAGHPAAPSGAAATFAQTKGNVWPHLAWPDLSRLAKGERLSRLVSCESLTDLGLSVAKVAGLAAVLWHAARADFLALGKLLSASPAGQLAGMFAPPSRAAGSVLVAIRLLAGLELAVTRHRFSAKMTMTKEEAKREYREEEGDPLLRSRRRRRQTAEVPRADARVVNPTHIAIALRYRKSKGKAPRVTAKGKGALAEHMRDLARSHGISVVEDAPLARLLYRRVKVGREVPIETYKAVAAILAFVCRVTGRSFGSS